MKDVYLFQKIAAERMEVITGAKVERAIHCLEEKQLLKLQILFGALRKSL